MTMPTASSRRPRPSTRDEELEQAPGFPHLVRIPEAARITGLPLSILRKSFMREERRPRNVPPPPPHKRIGRSIYIFADALATWVQSLGVSPPSALGNFARKRGRPTVAARIARRQQETM